MICGGPNLSLGDGPIAKIRCAGSNSSAKHVGSHLPRIVVIMFAPIRCCLWFVLLILVIARPAWLDAQEAGSRPRTGQASGSPTSDVIDDGGMFSAEAIRQAKETLTRIDRTYKVAVTVETIESLRNQELEEVAIRRAEQLDHKGIFILIARQDRKAEALASPKALRDELTRPRLHAIRDAFTAEFRKGDVDAGLIKGVQAAAKILGEIRPEIAREAAVTEGGVSGGNSALILRGQVRLTAAGAKKVIAGAVAKATEMKLKSNLTVVDDAGLLLAFERMDGARPASISTSQTKAISAATFRVPTGPVAAGNLPNDPLFNLSLQGAAATSGGKITALLGGLPILVDGQVVGAIGVAGGSGEQDLEVAKAGVAAFVAGLGETSDEKPKDKDDTRPKATDTVEPMPR